MADTKMKPVRFYRGKLPTIVWDARYDRQLCDLSEGHYTTDDDYTIKVLKSIGYIQIPLNATRPPDIYEAIQPAGMNDIKPLPVGLTEKGAPLIVEEEVKLAEDHDGPAVPVPKVKAKDAIEQKNTPKAKKRSRPIKRRK